MVTRESDSRELLMNIVYKLNDISDLLDCCAGSGILNANYRDFLFAVRINTAKKKDEYKMFAAFETAVSEVLEEYGIHRNNIGYTYMIEAVKIIVDVSSLDLQLNNDVYPLIASKYGLNGTSAVEHGIRNAICAAYRDYENHRGADRMKAFDRRPSNKSFLFRVTEDVCHRMLDIIDSWAG